VDRVSLYPHNQAIPPETPAFLRWGSICAVPNRFGLSSEHCSLLRKPVGSTKLETKGREFCTQGSSGNPYVPSQFPLTQTGEQEGGAVTFIDAIVWGLNGMVAVGCFWIVVEDFALVHGAQGS
jgi:hypothetical protein